MSAQGVGAPGVSSGEAARWDAAIQLVEEVAHDLNNALLVIRGYGAVLRAALEESGQIADVDEILKAADDAAGLTRRLLGLARSQADDEQGESLGGVDGGSETILLVEDDLAVRELLCCVLEGVGYDVLSASCPSEAELLIERQSNVDLLVTDVVMPEMSGFELAERVGGSRPNLPVLFISGHAYAASRPMPDGAELLKKPFQPNQLAQAVRRALDGVTR
jgi:CheY-like chemotaxis protein